MEVLTLFLALALEAVFIVGVSGHGRMMEPPSRGSMWRKGYDSPVNYGDNHLFCGGFKHQWEDMGGKCGVCGDPFDGPRDHEPGGKYYSGIITRSYQTSQVIGVQVELTAFHKGWFEFRLCPLDYRNQTVGQGCFDRFKLKILTESESGLPSRYQLPLDTKISFVDLKVKLPEGVSCDQCVLQWKYHSANSWGTDPSGNGCVGCGGQEEFYGCSDVSITRSGDAPPHEWARARSENVIAETPTVGSHPQQQLLRLGRNGPNRISLQDIKKMITRNADKKQNDWYGFDHLGQKGGATTSSSLDAAEFRTPTAKKVALIAKAIMEDSKSKDHCRASGPWAGSQSMTDWCIINCERGFCPETHCNCDRIFAFNEAKPSSVYLIRPRNDPSAKMYRYPQFGNQKAVGQYWTPHGVYSKKEIVPSQRQMIMYPEGRSFTSTYTNPQSKQYGHRNGFQNNRKWGSMGLKNGFSQAPRSWNYNNANRFSNSVPNYGYRSGLSQSSPNRQTETKSAFSMKDYEKSFLRLFPEYKTNMFTPANHNRGSGLGLNGNSRFYRPNRGYNQGYNDAKPLGESLSHFDDVPTSILAEFAEELGGIKQIKSEFHPRKVTPTHASTPNPQWFLKGEDIFKKLNEDRDLIAKARFKDSLRQQSSSSNYRRPESRETSPPKKKYSLPLTKSVCMASGAWKGMQTMDAWCQTNCAVNNCPKTHCTCA